MASIGTATPEHPDARPQAAPGLRTPCRPGHAVAAVATSPEPATAVGFVIGLPRSGTTLLGSLLAAAPGTLSISEPYLAHSLYSRWRLRAFFRGVQRRGGLARIGPPQAAGFDRLLDYMRRLTVESGLYRLIVKETYRSTREWRNTELMGWIGGLPHPVVAILRHPYDVAVSSIRFCRWWRGIPGRAMRLVAPRLPLFADDGEVVAHVADNWASFAPWCSAHAGAVVRYEDLVAGPAGPMEKVCATLRIPFDPAMLEQGRSRRAFGGIGDPRTMRRKRAPVRKSSVGRYAELSPALRRLIADRCGREAGAFGYTL